MENYTLRGPHGVWHFRSNGLPPGWAIPPGTVAARRTSVGPRVLAGPNYDGTVNSITAALLYNPIRRSVRYEVLVYMIQHPHWINGRFLIDNFGTEALRRVREIRENLGWPVIERSRSRGVWQYRMDLSQARQVRIWRRRYTQPRSA